MIFYYSISFLNTANTCIMSHKPYDNRCLLHNRKYHRQCKLLNIFSETCPEMHALTKMAKTPPKFVLQLVQDLMEPKPIVELHAF